MGNKLSQIVSVEKSVRILHPGYNLQNDSNSEETLRCLNVE